MKLDHKRDIHSLKNWEEGGNRLGTIRLFICLLAHKIKDVSIVYLQVVYKRTEEKAFYVNFNPVPFFTVRLFFFWLLQSLHHVSYTPRNDTEIVTKIFYDFLSTICPSRF